MIDLMQPELISLDSESIAINVPLTNYTKSGWDSMFMGALSSGFDLAGGFLCFRRATELSIGMVFKDASIRFLRRADGDVLFECTDGIRVQAALADASANPENRFNVPIEIRAFVNPGPKLNRGDPVAVATMTLSLKKIPAPVLK